ncbi:uncharacterized protein DS421_11g337900 [Arachis hypogaea]|nr:uncharacterized protein DS421_11g337900 [Arachis hypogaea]
MATFYPPSENYAHTLCHSTANHGLVLDPVGIGFTILLRLSLTPNLQEFEARHSHSILESYSEYHRQEAICGVERQFLCQFGRSTPAFDPFLALDARIGQRTGVERQFTSFILVKTWAWLRLPHLAPVPREPHSFPLANRWRNWDRGGGCYRYLSLAHFRKAFDDLQEGHFVWQAYAVDRIEPDTIPPEIYMDSVVWSATVPLVSFECIEWHSTDRITRQFGFIQVVPHQERSLEPAHGEVLTGPKNLDWTTAPTHSFWVMQWTNRYNHILTDNPVAPHHALEIYMDWYRKKYGNHLNLSDLVVQENDDGNPVREDDPQEQENDPEEQENDEPQSPPPQPQPPEEQPQSSNPYVPQTLFTPSMPLHQQYWGSSQFDTGEGASFSQLLGFMAADSTRSHTSHQPDIMAGRYSLDARFPCRTPSVTSGGIVSGDSSRSEGSRGILISQDPRRVSMGLIEENPTATEQAVDDYLVDEPEDDESEDDDMDEDDDKSGDDDPGHAYDAGLSEPRTPAEIGKAYNMRVDPPHHSANRFTPSVFKKAAKKCKKFVKDVKWSMRK